MPMTDASIHRAYRVMHHPQAPGDERADAQAQLFATHLDPDTTEQAWALLAQALGPNYAAQIHTLEKALPVNRTGQPTSGPAGAASMFYPDEQRMFGEVPGVRGRPGPVGYTTLRETVRLNPALQAIIKTRIMQVLRFMRPYRAELRNILGEPAGWDIRPVGGALGDVDPRSDMAARRRQLINFVRNSGDASGVERRELGRDDLRSFMAHVLRDRLTLDARAVELEYTAGGELSGYYAVDGATIFHAAPEGFPTADYGGFPPDPTYKFVQVVDMRPVTLYDHASLVYSVSNPRTDLMYRGYGWSEAEMSIRLTTGILNALATNIAGFDRSVLPQGVLLLRGHYSQQSVISFQQEWNAMRRGAAQSHAFPTLFTRDPNADAKWVDLGKKFDEMMFSRFISFLLAVGTAIFGMDPAEVNASAFSSERSPLSGNDTEERLTSARDKGFQPLMDELAEWMTGEVLAGLLGEDWEFVFTGLGKNEGEKLLQVFQRSALMKEARQLWGGQPLGDDRDDVFMDNAAAQQALAFGKEMVPPGVMGEGGGQGQGQGDGGEGGDEEMPDNMVDVAGAGPDEEEDEGPQAPQPQPQPGPMQKSVARFEISLED